VLHLTPGNDAEAAAQRAAEHFSLTERGRREVSPGGLVPCWQLPDWD